MKLKFLAAFAFLFFFSTSRSQEASPRPIFRNGEAQVVPAFRDKKMWIREELWVETNFDSDRDGKPDRMHVFVTRPAQTENGNLQLPVIYSSSPYYGLKLFTSIGLDQKKKIYYDLRQELGENPKKRKHSNPGTRKKRPLMAFLTDNQWVPRGYIMVYSSSPGTGLSDGVPTIGGENESLAPKAVIDWLCGRAKGYTTRRGTTEVKAFWCSRKVGMTGTSYDGTLCIAAATTGVEGLEAIIPIAPVTSFYEYYRSNGLVRSPEGYFGEDMDVLYDFIHTGDKSKRKNNNRFMRDSTLVLGQDRRTGDYNDFWESRDYLLKISRMKAAMLMAHAFNDWNVMPSHSVRFYEAAKKLGIPVQLYMHQGGHGGEPPFEMMNRWFTRYLHGVENKVEKDTPVRIVREYQIFPDHYSAFPDEKSELVQLYLRGDADNSGELNFSPYESNEEMTIFDNYKIKGKELLNHENHKHRLLFVTPKLKQDIRISGTCKVTIQLSSNRPAANLSVWLVALPVKTEKRTPIFENLITRGWADPQNHKSLRKGEALIPNQSYEVLFDLQPDDQVISAGKQIGLLIFSSDKEFTLWPKPGAELTIEISKTNIQIPVVGGKATLEKAFGL